MTQPILVIHAEAERLVHLLAPTFPDERFVGVDRLSAIGPALEEHAPEIVFCIKSTAFLGPEFHRITQQPSVRWVNVGGSGVEHLGAWDRSRVTVTHSAGVLAPYLAETWLGAVLALEGGLLECATQTTWSNRRFRTLEGQRLLLVGLGEVGSRVAKLAASVGMEVEAVRAHPGRGGAPAVFAAEALDQRLPEADVVSLHVRLDASTHRLFDRRRLGLIRRSALFVNTARGGLVDESALVHSLTTGALRGAYLDVFEEEPLPESSPLWRLKNVLITPHAADQVSDWAVRFVDRFVAQLRRHRCGEPLEHVAV